MRNRVWVHLEISWRVNGVIIPRTLLIYGIPYYRKNLRLVIGYVSSEIDTGCPLSTSSDSFRFGASMFTSDGDDSGTGLDAHDDSTQRVLIRRGVCHQHYEKVPEMQIPHQVVISANWNHENRWEFAEVNGDLSLFRKPSRLACYFLFLNMASPVDEAGIVNQ